MAQKVVGLHEYLPYAVGILFLVEKIFFCYHTNVIHIYNRMPGGRQELLFDTSDIEADIKAEKQQKALEQKAIKHPVAELEDLSDEAMEIADEGDEIKKSLESMVNENNDSLPTLDQNLLQEDSDEEVHEITDDMIIPDEEASGTIIEYPDANYEYEGLSERAQEANRAFDRAIARAKEILDDKVTPLLQERASMNNILSKNKTLLATYEPRFKHISNEITRYKNDHKEAVAEAYKAFEEAMADEPDSIAKARRKKQARSMLDQNADSLAA